MGKGRFFPIFVFLLAFAYSSISSQAEAKTKYAEDTGKNCNFCHADNFQLNNNGKQFKDNGYSLAPASQPAGSVSEKKPATVKFRDMKSHWAREQVEFLAEKGIIAGYTDGTYLPTQNISKQQFAELVRRVLGITMADPAAEFLEEWYYSKANLSRASAVEIIIRALGKSESALNMPPQERRNLLSLVKDGDNLGEREAPFLAQALKADLVEGYKDKKFQPQRNLTRGEAAALIYAFYNAR